MLRSYCNWKAFSLGGVGQNDKPLPRRLLSASDSVTDDRRMTDCVVVAVEVGGSEIVTRFCLLFFLLHARFGEAVLEARRVLSFLCLCSVSLCSSVVIEHVSVSLTSAKSVLFFRVLSICSISSL